MRTLPLMNPHRADFVIWIDGADGVPYGEATTDRGREAYGHESFSMLYIDASEFWANVPDDIVVGVLTDDNGLQYASKNCLQ